MGWLVVHMGVLWEWGWSDYKADLFQSLVITTQWGLGAVQPQCSHFPSFPVSQITALQGAPRPMITIRINSITVTIVPWACIYETSYLSSSPFPCCSVVKYRIRQFEDMWLASQITEMFLYLFGRAWNENHIDFHSPFLCLPLICSKGDSDTVVAEGDLAARAVLAPFQRMREDVKASEAARAEPSLSASCCAVVLNTQPLLHFYTHSGASELLPCCFLVSFFLIYIFSIFIYLFGCAIS